jgi:L-fuculose-phosphate aldolase
MWREISKFGKKMVQCGLTHSHFGNISVRVGNKLIITRSSSMLDEIDENMVVELDLDKASSFDTIASSETIVHRHIYKETSALAIIHAHSAFAIVQSMISSTNLLIPTDCESKYFLHEIPIITGGVGSRELAQNAANALKDHKGAIIKEHGPIAIGKIIEEAFVTICSIEHACKVKYFTDLFLQDKG